MLTAPSLVHARHSRVDGVLSLCPRQVLEAAHEWFGLPRDDPTISVHACDGIAFLASAAKSGILYDAVLVDACVSDAIDHAPLELPPAAFVSEHFLKEVVLPSVCMCPQASKHTRDTSLRLRCL